MSTITQYGYMIAPILLFLLILFYPFAALAINVCKACRNIKSLGMSKETIRACIPIFNLAFIHEELYNSSMVISILCYIVLGGLLCRPLGLILYFINPSLAVLGQIIFLAALALWYVLMIYTCLDLCTVLHRNLFNKLLSILLAPAMAYILSGAVPVYFRKQKEIVSGTFDNLKS